MEIQEIKMISEITQTRISKILCVYIMVFVFSTTSFAEDEAPYALEAVYTADYLTNTTGGSDEGSAYMDNFDLLFDIDANLLWGIDGGTFHVHILTNNGKTFSDIVGDAQVVSNIDNSSVVRLYEMWWQQDSGNHSVKFGLYDLNSEFDAIDTAGLFLNSSHGIGAEYAQSGENGPSIFPTTSLSLRYSYQLSEQVLLQAAVLDAVPGDPDDPHKNTIDLDTDDLLLALEINYSIENTCFTLGTWHYTKEIENLDVTAEDNNSGIYGIVEHQFFNPDEDSPQLSGWLRFGMADDDINQFDNYLGSGLVLANFIQTRPDDSLGIAIARASNGDKFRAINSGTDSSETTIELTYQMPINDYITIQPDIQYILNPGTDSLLDDALVIGIRFELSLL